MSWAAFSQSFICFIQLTSALLFTDHNEHAGNIIFLVTLHLRTCTLQDRNILLHAQENQFLKHLLEKKVLGTVEYISEIFNFQYVNQIYHTTTEYAATLLVNFLGFFIWLGGKKTNHPQKLMKTLYITSLVLLSNSVKPMALV